MIVPFKTIAGALNYLSNNSLLGWTIEVQAGIYLEKVVLLISSKNSGVTIHLSGGVSIQGDPSNASKGLFTIDGDTSATIVGDAIDGSYNHTSTAEGPLGGASIVTRDGQEMFELSGNVIAAQKLNISNIALIQVNTTDASANMFNYSIVNADDRTRHHLNITNCYLRQDGIVGSFIIFGTGLPNRTIIDIRGCYHFTAAKSGVSYNFTNWSTEVLALRLRDNIFYAPFGTSIGPGNTGHIFTNASNGGEFRWYWQGNTFYATYSVATGTPKFYAWYDSGNSTTACRLIQTTPSIHNYETFNSPPIVNMTPVTMYGPLKTPPPEYWNRS